MAPLRLYIYDIFDIGCLLGEVAGQLASWRFAHRYNTLLVDVIIKDVTATFGTRRYCT
jgi:hypothetical protein